jgi:hypothetical protein
LGGQEDGVGGQGDLVGADAGAGRGDDAPALGRQLVTQAEHGAGFAAAPYQGHHLLAPDAQRTKEIHWLYPLT